MTGTLCSKDIDTTSNIDGTNNSFTNFVLKCLFCLYGFQN